MRVGIQLLQHLHDCARARFRASGTGHGRRVPSSRDDRGAHPRRSRRLRDAARRDRRARRGRARRRRSRRARRRRLARPRAPGADSVGFLVDGRAYVHVARATPSDALELDRGHRPHRPRRARPAATTHAARRRGRARRAARRRSAHVLGVRRDRRRRRPFAAAGFEAARRCSRCAHRFPVAEVGRTGRAGINVRDFEPGRDDADVARA